MRFYSNALTKERNKTYEILGKLQESEGKVQALQDIHQDAQRYEERLSQLFGSLSSKALKDNSSLFLQQTREQLSGIVSPLQKDMERLDTSIVNLEKQREGAFTSLNSSLLHLNKEIKELYTANSDLTKSTLQLNSALRSDVATRGHWGEIQLRRIVEISGMKQHIDFLEQVSTSAGRPDMIIKLPSEGIIPVDAKTPMSAYLEACQASTEEQKKNALYRHKQSLHKHIATLSKKEYWTAFDRTPQLVIMFVPYESGIEASFSIDPDLLDNALLNKVIVAGPSSLYALLKVISFGWMQIELSKNAEEILSASQELFKRFSTFFEHYKKIGVQLKSAVDSYNNANSSCKARLLPQLQRIKEMGVKQSEVLDDADLLPLEHPQYE
ncbi:DNA recombination protein RmuC homolog [Ylistrum balloti]|uniref:DNA recombination protein RmuC homolog n=1 Tax=Ylistrum balloti TaxID=509963 RepID=UPI002905993E|nr:DNA recombination protein RmuC homolog [Ylistrum balloti]